MARALKKYKWHSQDYRVTIPFAGLTGRKLTSREAIRPSPELVQYRLDNKIDVAPLGRSSLRNAERSSPSSGPGRIDRVALPNDEAAADAAAMDLGGNNVGRLRANPALDDTFYRFTERRRETDAA